jgi:ribonuclease P protein component
MSAKKMVQIKRLKSKTRIDLLFQQGEMIHSKTLLLRYRKSPESGVYFSGVSAPKKTFARAVDRNRIKRLLRVALEEVPSDDLFHGSGMLLYRGEKIPTLENLTEEVLSLFLRVKKNESLL